MTQERAHLEQVFLFTSLLICAGYGHWLAGIKNGHHSCYRCRTYIERKTCPHKEHIQEAAVEAILAKGFRNIYDSFEPGACRQQQAGWYAIPSGLYK